MLVHHRLVLTFPCWPAPDVRPLPLRIPDLLHQGLKRAENRDVFGQKVVFRQSYRLKTQIPGPGILLRHFVPLQYPALPLGKHFRIIRTQHRQNRDAPPLTVHLAGMIHQVLIGARFQYRCLRAVHRESLREAAKLFELESHLGRAFTAFHGQPQHTVGTFTILDRQPHILYRPDDAGSGSSRERMIREGLAIGASHLVPNQQLPVRGRVGKDILHNQRVRRKHASGAGGPHIHEKTRHHRVGASLTGSFPAALICFVLDRESRRADANHKCPYKPDYESHIFHTSHLTFPGIHLIVVLFRQQQQGNEPPRRDLRLQVSIV
jgi:hypothetical protein